MSLLTVNNLHKIYKSRFATQQVHALNNLSFSVEAGEFVAIMGESGSGKTSLLHLLAALDSPTSGEIFLEGRNIASITETEISAYRRENLGFVFQDFNLLDTLTVRDNIYLPLVLAGVKHKEIEPLADSVAIMLGLSVLLDKFPYEISGGEKQKTAVARALVTKPKLILADEPTGSLDSRASESLLQVLQEINQGGQTVLMVTHSIKAASHATRVLFLRDGAIFHQIYRGKMDQSNLYKKISEVLTILLTGRRDVT